MFWKQRSCKEIFVVNKILTVPSLYSLFMKQLYTIGVPIVKLILKIIITTQETNQH